MVKRAIFILLLLTYVHAHAAWAGNAVQDWNLLIDVAVEEFDNELARAQNQWSLHKSPAYIRLLALRELREEAEAYLNDAPELLTSSLSGTEKSRRIRDLRANPLVSVQIAAKTFDLAFAHNAGLVNGYRFTGPFAPGLGPSGNLNGNEVPSGHFLLTFDDGPHPKYTDQIANELKKEEAHATFFWLAKNVKNNTSIVRRMEQAGHSLQNHSFSHANLLRANQFALGREISLSTAIQTEAYSQRPRYFRCPYGAGMNVKRVRELIAKEKMVHVFWNVDSLDWADHNPTRVAKRVLKQMDRVGGGIILFHDIHAHTPRALGMVLKANQGRVVWLSL